MPSLALRSMDSHRARSALDSSLSLTDLFPFSLWGLPVVDLEGDPRSSLIQLRKCLVIGRT